MKHTPGPWIAHPYNLRMGSLISYGDLSQGENVGIAMGRIDPEEGKANARLIAAAPDLYEQLRDITTSGLSLSNTRIAKALLAKIEEAVC